MNEHKKSALRSYRRLIDRDVLLPGAFIVGAQKAGTSALYSYLEKHPEILVGDEKEIGFFSRDKLYGRGPRYYHSCFSLFTADKSLTIDATPEYLYYPHCAERMYERYPMAKVIVVLREPLSRAFSAYNMYKKIYKKKWFISRVSQANTGVSEFFMPLIRGEKVFDIEVFLEREMAIIASGEEIEEPSLIRRGVYAAQIQRYYDYFPKINIMILFSNDLKSHPQDAVARTQEFLGIQILAENTYPPRNVLEYSATSGERALIKQYSQEIFDYDRVRLTQSMGVNVPW